MLNLVYLFRQDTKLKPSKRKKKIQPSFIFQQEVAKSQESQACFRPQCFLSRTAGEVVGCVGSLKLLFVATIK